jgi:predicted MFS family arabinose efflux permease
LAQAASGVAVAVMIAVWLPMEWGGSSLVAFMAAFLLADGALQGVHISNQNIVYALDPAARSRVNAVYMTVYVVGAAAGSAIGSAAWKAGGWTGVCVAGFALSAACGLAWLWDLRLARRSPTGKRPTVVERYKGVPAPKPAPGE